MRTASPGDRIWPPALLVRVKLCRLFRLVVLRLMARPTVEPMEVDWMRPELVMLTVPVPGRMASSPAAVIWPPTSLVMPMVAAPEVMPALNDRARPPPVLVDRMAPKLSTVTVPAPISASMRKGRRVEVGPEVDGRFLKGKLRGLPVPDVSMPRDEPVALMVPELLMTTGLVF